MTTPRHLWTPAGSLRSLPLHGTDRVIPDAGLLVWRDPGSFRRLPRINQAVFFEAACRTDLIRPAWVVGQFDYGRIVHWKTDCPRRIFGGCPSSDQLSWRGKIPGLAGELIFYGPMAKRK